jgi:hypothetical protein
MWIFSLQHSAIINGMSIHSLIAVDQIEVLTCAFAHLDIKPISSTYRMHITED